MTDWAAERQDVLDRFAAELAKATGDGSKKRQSGEKPPWYIDPAHEGAIFSHITKWKRGELVDPDSGAHPLVHAAWRCLAIACRESGNTPQRGVQEIPNGLDEHVCLVVSEDLLRTNPAAVIDQIRSHREDTRGQTNNG